MSSSVPSFSLAKQWARIKKRVLPKIEILLEQQACIGGPAVTAFEEAISNYIGVNHAIGCGSGTSALWLAMRALDIAPGDIVLTTPFSFVASASQIHAHGATPVFIDIDPETLNINPAALADWLQTNTEQRNGRTVEQQTGRPVVGILAVHIFGLCADMTALRAQADQHKLWLIEDAAQAVGATHKTQAAGMMGDAACFSFYPTKNLSACGDAGLVTTQNEARASRMRRIQNHGRQDHYTYAEYGINSRLDAIQAVILQEKLTILPDLLAQRRSIARRYSAGLRDIPGIQLPVDAEHTYHQYTILIDERVAGFSRDQLDEHLRGGGIGTRIFYPQLLSEVPYLQTEQALYTHCPIARSTVTRMLSLPIWPEMSDEQVATVIAAITAYACQPSSRSSFTEIRS